MRDAEKSSRITAAHSSRTLQQHLTPLASASRFAASVSSSSAASAPLAASAVSARVAGALIASASLSASTAASAAAKANRAVSAVIGATGGALDAELSKRERRLKRASDMLRSPAHGHNTANGSVDDDYRLQKVIATERARVWADNDLTDLFGPDPGARASAGRYVAYGTAVTANGSDDDENDVSGYDGADIVASVAGSGMFAATQSQTNYLSKGAAVWSQGPKPDDFSASDSSTSDLDSDFFSDGSDDDSDRFPNNITTPVISHDKGLAVSNGNVPGGNTVNATNDSKRRTKKTGTRAHASSAVVIAAAHANNNHNNNNNNNNSNASFLNDPHTGTNAARDSHSGTARVFGVERGVTERQRMLRSLVDEYVTGLDYARAMPQRLRAASTLPAGSLGVASVALMAADSAAAAASANVEAIAA